MAETKENQYYGLGRRKEATARVHLIAGGSGKVTVNGKDLGQYFGTDIMRQNVVRPFTAIGMEGKFDVNAATEGGGITGQADAIRLGISRALLDFNPEYRAVLKKSGFLTRDARKRERKKYGKKSARRSPQWAKR